MQTHRAALAQKPFAAFLVCMTLAMPNADKYREHVSSFLQPVRALVKPASEGLFAGVLDISQVSSFSDKVPLERDVGRLVGGRSQGLERHSRLG